MILVDTSVWVGHLRSNDEHVRELLEANQVCSHPFLVGETAMGSLRQRSITLESLAELPECAVGTDSEVLRFVTMHKLYGVGIGFVDAHLLVAALLTPATQLWTRDKRLDQLARQHAVGYGARA